MTTHQPPPRECDSCGKQFTDGKRYHLELSSFSDLSDTGADICMACNIGGLGYDKVVELIRTRRRGLQSPTPPAAFAVGDEVEWDERDNAKHSGEGEEGTGRGKVERIEAGFVVRVLLSSDYLGCKAGDPWWVDQPAIRLIRHAASAQPESFKVGDLVTWNEDENPWKQEASANEGLLSGEILSLHGGEGECAGALIELDRPLKRYGDRTWNVPLSALTRRAATPPSPPVAAVASKVDPYAAHNARVQADQHYAGWRIRQNVLESNREVRRVRLEREALAELDRPIRTGPCKTRDKYGQLLSLRGWNTDDVDDELGCS